MIGRKTPSIVLEKIALARVAEHHEIVVESSSEWFVEGMIPKPDLTLDELKELFEDFVEGWEKDTFYLFSILDASTNEVVGAAFLNHVNRQHQLANLGYQVRTSRTGEGIGTKAAKLVAQYGFRELGFLRIEIVVRPANFPSVRVAEKLGAVQEGLLRNRLQVNGSPNDAFMFSLIPSDLDG